MRARDSRSLERLGRHVFPVEGHHLAARRPAASSSVGIGEAAEQRGRHLVRGRAGFAIEEQEVEAERIAGQRHHAAQLAGAEHADGHAGSRGSGCASTASVCAWRKRVSAAATRGVVQRHDGGGKQRGVGGARRADGEGGHRNALGHLHDRQQRIEAVQRLGLHRHAQHRHARLGGRHAGQVGRAAGAGDDRREAAAFGLGWRIRTAGPVCGARRPPSLRAARRAVPAVAAAGCRVSQSDLEPMMMPTSGFICAV